MKLSIEFPMNVIAPYNGPDNLDETLDNNISFLIGKYFYDNKIEFKILDLSFAKPIPNENDELVRYEIEIDVSIKEFKIEWIINSLEDKGFEKGLTIKKDRNILYADEFTADIKYRRENTKVQINDESKALSVKEICKLWIGLKMEIL